MFNYTTRSQIEAMTAKQMIVMFNEITGGNLVKFQNRADGIKRLMDAIAAQTPETPAMPETDPLIEAATEIKNAPAKPTTLSKKKEKAPKQEFDAMEIRKACSEMATALEAGRKITLAIRDLATDYPHFPRFIVINICKECNINPATASTQFQRARKSA